MTEMLSLPLLPGIRQDVDRTMLPPGSIIRAENVRLRKGGLAKRNGFVDAGTTPQDTVAGALSGPVDALGSASGRQVAVFNGRAYMRPAMADKWQESGRASRARPVRVHWIAFDERSECDFACCAAAGGLVAVAYARPNVPEVRVVLLDDAGIRRVTQVFAGYTLPRMFSVGGEIILTMKESGDVGLFASKITATEATPGQWAVTFGTATLLADSHASGDVYDAAPFSSTHFLLLRRNDATHVEVQLYNLSLTSTASQEVTRANATLAGCSIFGIPGGFIAGAFNESPSSKFFVCSDSLSAVTATPTAYGPQQFGARIAYIRGAATTSGNPVGVYWEEVTGSPTRWTTKVQFYTVGGSAALANPVAMHSVRLASRPHLLDGRPAFWLHTDNNANDGSLTQWATQRKYLLATLAFTGAAAPDHGGFVAVELQPDERAVHTMGFSPPEIATRSVSDEFGRLVDRAYFAARAVVRTQESAVGTAAIVLYEYELNTQRDARARQVLDFGGGVVAGGGLQELPSSRVAVAADAQATSIVRGVENGFIAPPQIHAATPASGGSLTADALYQFVAVAEYIGPDGLRVRSAPSSIVAATPTGANLTVDLEIAVVPRTEREAASPPNATVIHVYGTVGNGNVFQRLTPDVGLSAGVGTRTDSVIEFAHSAADATVLDNEILYTEGGVIANQPAPAHRFGTVGGGRLWLGGLFDPRIVEVSKALAPNEPVQFTRHPAFRCLLPEPVTGLAWMDGALVVFSERAVYLVPGAAPNNQGRPALGEAQRLPSSVGCIDHRSIVETPEGIVFQSRRGIELLPRGFGSPKLFSLPVQDALRGRVVISGTVTGHAGSSFGEDERLGERLLVLMAIGPSEPGVRLVFDLDAGRWVSIDPAPVANDGEFLTAWDGRLVAGARTGTTLRYESPTDWGSVEAVPVTLELADLRPFGVISRGQAHRVFVLGETRSVTEVTLTATQDGRYSKPLEFQQATQRESGTRGDKFLLEWNLPVRQVNALGLTLSMADPEGATPGEGLVLHAIGLEAEGLPGRPRTSRERTAA